MIQIIRINLSQTLPLSRLSHRMPCCLTSVPVGNTYTIYAAKCFALTAYIQMLIIALLSGMGCFAYILHFCTMAFVVEGHFSHASLSMVE